MRIMTFALIFLFFQSACNDGVMDNSNPDDPSNLVVDFITYDDGSGIVVINASANNTIEYVFDMGEPGVDLISSAQGDLEYTYKTSGAYTIDVRAYGKSGRYISKKNRLNISAEEPIDIGQGYSTPISYPDMDLVWNDEFDGLNLNDNDWTYDIGNGCPSLCGWGNNELEYYRAENVSVGNGVLKIEAKRENFQNYDYTSGKIVTRSKQAFQYGRIDIRATLPDGGQGMWPAFWLLGTNQPAVGWPKCGEIDIMEMVGGNGKENRVTGNVFWDDNGTRDQPSGYSLDSGFFYDEFHVFSIVWDETKIRWMVDDEEFKSFDITSAVLDEFRKPFYMIINLAVGGNWPGSPDDTTVFPTDIKVDYVRVFKDK